MDDGPVVVDLLEELEVGGNIATTVMWRFKCINVKNLDYLFTKFTEFL